MSTLVTIPPSLMILMHQQGWQIDDKSLSHLLQPNSASLVHLSPASSQTTPEIFCFNRDHLDTEFDELEAELTLTASSFLSEPPLPAPDATHSVHQLAQAHARTSQAHLTNLQRLLHSLSLQRDALGAALLNLDNHLKGKQGGFDTFELFATPLLQNYAALLKAYDPALTLLGRIHVHPNLMASASTTSSGTTPSNSRRQSSDGQPQPNATHARLASNASTSSTTSRWLAEYVSKDKIAIVRDQCSAVYSSYLPLRLSAYAEITATSR